jgi:hypothetical protein
VIGETRTSLPFGRSSRGHRNIEGGSAGRHGVGVTAAHHLDQGIGIDFLERALVAGVDLAYGIVVKHLEHQNYTDKAVDPWIFGKLRYIKRGSDVRILSARDDGSDRTRMVNACLVLDTVSNAHIFALEASHTKTGA